MSQCRVCDKAAVMATGIPEVEENKEMKTTPSVLYRFSIASAEYLGTAILVMITCMGCTQGMTSEYIPILQRSLTSGMAVMITIHLFGHVSGAHCNPMTTICAVIVGETKLILAPIYFLAQMGGGLTGYGLLMLATPPESFNTNFNGTETKSSGVCITSPSEGLTPLQAVLVEICVTLILVFGNCSAWDPVNSSRNDSTALRIGFLVTAVSMAAGSYTGGSMNPARSFAPAFWNNYWENHWIYWIAPVTAALTGSTFYKVAFLKSKKRQPQR